MFGSFFGPHFPYAAPEPWDTRYDLAEVPRPANFDERVAGKPLTYPWPAPTGARP